MRFVVRALAIAAVLAGMLVGAAASVGAGSPASWSTYLFDNQHSSYNPTATAITPAVVPKLTEQWVFHAPGAKNHPPTRLYASPTVVGNAVYIGSNSGFFYKLDRSTGQVIWKVDLGFVLPGTIKPTCRAKGILATAAVAQDPVTGKQTVYVAAGDGNVDALQPSDGTVEWKSPVNIPDPGTQDHYNFSSPLVANGHVYEGISASCDHPLTRGGLAELDQHTGARLATYWDVPEGAIGGSIWSSPAITPDGSTIFVTTGNGDPHDPNPADQGDSFSIVALDANTLAKTDIWTIPVVHGDQDFGGSPTLFTAKIDGVKTAMVGAINKDGFYRAWRQNDLAAGPVWSVKYGAKYEVASTAWDGTHLFMASGNTTIDGVSYPGALRELDPATGAAIWQTPVSAPDLGFTGPTLDGGGVLAVPTYDTTDNLANADIFVDTQTGAILREFPLTRPTFGQTVFAGNQVFVSDGGQGAANLYAYGPPLG